MERELSSTHLSRYSVQIVALLILVEIVADFFLWTRNPISQSDQGVFAVLLGINLVSLAMISNIYRAYKHGDQLNRSFLVIGSCLILLLVFVSLAL